MLGAIKPFIRLLMRKEETHFPVLSFLGYPVLSQVTAKFNKIKGKDLKRISLPCFF